MTGYIYYCILSCTVSDRQCAPDNEYWFAFRFFGTTGTRRIDQFCLYNLSSVALKATT